MHSSELDIYDIMEVITSETHSPLQSHLDHHSVGGECSSRVTGSSGGRSRGSGSSETNSSHYLTSLSSGGTAAASQQDKEPVSAYLGAGGAKHDSSFYDHALDAEAADSTRVFNKYQTQPASVLREKIQTIEMERAQNQGNRYSTTGSYIAEDSLHSPNNERIMYCVAAILQAEVIVGSNTVCTKCPEFELPNNLPDEMFPDREEQSRGGATLDRRASFEFMIRFLTYIYMRVQYQPECNIVALIYVNRMTADTDLVLTPSNWHNVWLCAIIIAQKMWEDKACKTSSFVQLLPGATKTQLRDMEWQVLALIKFDINIKASLYTRYYFELRQMYRELGLELGEMSDKKPLTAVKERQLEERSSNRRPVQRSDIRRRELGGAPNLASARHTRAHTRRHRRTRMRCPLNFPRAQP